MVYLIAYNFQGNFILTNSMQLFALSHATSSELVKAIVFPRHCVIVNYRHLTKTDMFVFTEVRNGCF